jgi:hypothetical protein
VDGEDDPVGELGSEMIPRGEAILFRTLYSLCQLV